MTKTGKRQVKCFSSLPEARNWLEDAKCADRHEDVFAPPDMTVTEWFEFWISHIVGAFGRLHKFLLLIRCKTFDVIHSTNRLSKANAVYRMLLDYIVHHGSPKHRSHSNICLADR